MVIGNITCNVLGTGTNLAGDIDVVIAKGNAMAGLIDFVTRGSFALTDGTLSLGVCAGIRARAPPPDGRWLLPSAAQPGVSLWRAPAIGSTLSARRRGS